MTLTPQCPSMFSPPCLCPCSSSFFVLPLAHRPLPLGEQLSLWRPLGAESLVVGGPGSLQPGHGRVPPPRAKWAIHHVAHRAGQTAPRTLLHRHAATHHWVSTRFLLHYRLNLNLPRDKTQPRDVSRIRNREVGVFDHSLLMFITTHLNISLGNIAMFTGFLRWSSES